MTGVIHDIGYQRYQGRRLGRWYAAGSLYLHSLRTAYGLGRTAKAKIFPWLVAGIVLAVAVVVTAVRAGLGGQQVLSYPDFSDSMTVLTALFVAVVAPELASRELRTGVLALYFSRPLRTTDYPLAKLLALVSAAWLLLAGPLLVMLLGGVFSVDGWSAIWDELVEFAGGLAYAGLYAVVLGVIALLVASLISRRAVAAGAIIAVFLVTTPVVGIISAVGGETARQLAGLASPFTIVVGVREWLAGGADAPVGDYGPWYGLAALVLVVAGVGLLLLRYRRVRQ